MTDDGNDGSGGRDDVTTVVMWRDGGRRGVVAWRVSVGLSAHHQAFSVSISECVCLNCVSLSFLPIFPFNGGSGDRRQGVAHLGISTST